MDMFVPFLFIPLFYILYPINNRAFCIYYGVGVERHHFVLAKNDVSKNILQRRIFTSSVLCLAQLFLCVQMPNPTIFVQFLKFRLFYFRNNICLYFLDI